MHHVSPVRWCVAWRMRYRTGSRRFRLGDAMSILARSVARAVRELAGAHAREQVEVLLDRAVAVRAVLPGLGQRAAVLADLARRSGRRRRPCPSWMSCDGVLVELLEVVRGVVELLAPVEAEPADVVLDRLDVLDVLLASGWCRRSAGCSARRSPGRCRSSGRSTWRGRCGGSRSAPAGSGCATRPPNRPVREVLVDDRADEVGRRGGLGGRHVAPYHSGRAAPAPEKAVRAAAASPGAG